QAIDRGAHQVDRVARALRLGQDVANTQHLENGAHRATGDDTGTFRRGLHEHLGGTVLRVDRVPDGALVQGHVDHRLAGALHRLLDRHRHFSCLAITEADLALAVTHHRQRGETEDAATFHRLGDTVDGDQLFDHAVVAVAVPLVAFVCHYLILEFVVRTSGRLHARHRPGP